MANLWCELLELEEIGIDDSFFDLGGNSLAAVRMVRQYESRFGHEIPPVKIFQHPTIAKLAEFLEANESKSDLFGGAEIARAITVNRTRRERTVRGGLRSRTPSEICKAKAILRITLSP